jgi:transposase
MARNIRFVALDVHAETIAVAVGEDRGQVRILGTIPNRPEAVQRLLGKVGKASELRVCCEAGPTGVRAALATDGDGHCVRGDRAVAGAEETR